MRRIHRSLILLGPALSLLWGGCSGNSESEQSDAILDGQTQGGSGGQEQGGSSGDSGAAGNGGSSGQAQGDCTKDADCAALPTTPPGCAEPKCDAAKKNCVYYAKDADQDSFPTGKCKALDGTTPIVLGEDCDDSNPDVNPKGWDGPAGDGHPNHCNDGVDQDCSGIEDDQKLKDGTTCTCSPGDTRDCSLDASGKPIKFPGGTPQGICAYGHQTCVDSGKWGPCVDAVAPNVEVCDPANNQDEDCDGLIDDADPDVLGKKTWYCDADSDGFLAPDVVAFESCKQPPGEQCAGQWVTSGQKIDCNDNDPNTFPGAKEICDGVRNDCDTTKQPDEGALAIATWYRDDDGDGHLRDLSLGGPLTRTQCDQPGATANDCPPGMDTCTNLWSTNYKNLDDCDDTNADRFPGNWDGPSTTQAGVGDKGFVVEFFQRTAASLVVGPDGRKTTAAIAAAEPIVDTIASSPVLAFNWALGRPSTKLNYDYFLMRATATLEIVEPGDYTFYLGNSDDGVRLWLGDQSSGSALINDWAWPQAAGKRQATLTLAAGTYPLRVEYFESTSNAYIQLDWSGPSFGQTKLRTKDPSSLGSRPNRCDDVDQDCDGNPDNAKSLANGSIRSCAMVCEPGSLDICDATDNIKNNLGICRIGRRICTFDGSTYGACTDQIDPQSSEVCNGDGKDYNCNGVTNTATGGTADCNCNVGSVQSCMAMAIKGPGWCGSASCQNNKWDTASCTQPPRDCSSANDNNCDGKPDNMVDGSYCKCSINATQSCPTTRADFTDAGACIKGQQQCVKAANGSSDWTACSGTTIPAQDQCQSNYDYNCDGRVGNAPGCIKTLYVLVPPSNQNPCVVAPSEMMISDVNNEAGWSPIATVAVWTSGDIPIRRCNCGYHTVAINESCPPGCTDESVRGFLSTKDGPGKGMALGIEFTGKSSKGLCSGTVGCLNLTAGCSTLKAMSNKGYGASNL